MARKMRRLNKLTGEIPCLYSRNTIYLMCIMINALVDAVNYLADQVEELQGKEG